MSSINYDDLWSMTAQDALSLTESEKKSFGSKDVYKPSIKDEKCKDNNYRSLIRFMPFIYEDKVRTTIERWECYLKDVNDNNAIFVVSPKTIGKKCPIRDLGWKLYSSESAIDKANSKKINVYQQWYALVEIIKDVQHPELNGTFMVYQFGKKIHDKIENALKGSEFSDAINPFHFLEAPLFEINLTKGTQKMDNGREVADYEACKFIEKKSPIHFGDGQTLEQTRESMDAYINWLKTDAPKINNFQWKDWDQETIDKVNQNLASYTSSYSAPRTTAATVSEMMNDIKNTGTENSSPKKPVEKPVEKPKVEEKEETVSTDDDEWLKSVLGD